jgi:hypothetical protein
MQCFDDVKGQNFGGHGAQPHSHERKSKGPLLQSYQLDKNVESSYKAEQRTKSLRSRIGQSGLL